MADHDELKAARDRAKKAMSRDVTSSGAALGAGFAVDFGAQAIVGQWAWLQQRQWVIGVLEVPVGHALRYLQNGAGLGVIGLAGGRLAEAAMAYLATRQAAAPQATGIGQGFNPHGFGSRQAARQLNAMNAGRSLNQVQVRQARTS